MSTELVTYSPAAIEPAKFFNPEQQDLIRRMIAPKATPDELKLFLYQAARTGLDPMSRQIYAIHRWDAQAGGNKMTIQVSIDGFRLIAERTGRYAPGPETTFEYKGPPEDGQVIKATAYVKKRTADGEWHTVAASAHFWEYAQTNKDGKLTAMWDTKRHVMLAKCAEALALRKAFPAEMSGLYTADEMAQADSEGPRAVYTPPAKEAPRSEAPKAPRAAIAAPAASTAGTVPIAATPTTAATGTASAPKGEAAPPAAPPESAAGALDATPSPSDREPGSDDDEEGPDTMDDPNDRVTCFKYDRKGNLVSETQESRRSEAQAKKLFALFRSRGIEEDDTKDDHGGPIEGYRKRLKKWFGKDSTKELSSRECSEVIDFLEGLNRRFGTAEQKKEKQKRRVDSWTEAAK